MIEKGYCCPVPTNVPVDKIWYVPHHCTSVFTKFRIVFDCSAKFNGVLLNDQLLQGPDLTNNLIGVLICFRQEPVAVVADIKGMFFQVLVDKKDCHIFRFLWFSENDLKHEPCEYQMRVHLFGATSSPCVAAFALHQAAMKNLTGADDEAVQTVFKNFYVDDMCKSCATAEQATELLKQICDLLDSGGFKLIKFLSNNKQVLSSISESDFASSVMDLHQRELPTQKALGVYWNAETDRFEVKVNIKEKLCTRCGLLSMVAQTYDPLGLLQPFILCAMKILQSACCMGLPWDELLLSTQGINESWVKLLQALPNLETVSFARCFKLSDLDVKFIELHVFSDASSDGYGACAYLRIVYCDDLINCLLVLGKSHVAPFNVISVPRLELTAKISVLIHRELDYDLCRVIFWTDATVVLCYLHNKATRFQTFVANRLKILYAVTSIEQWRYVPTNLNPADIASRGLSPERVNAADLWFNGPQFLLCDESKWPKQSDSLEGLNEEDKVVFNTSMCPSKPKHFTFAKAVFEILLFTIHSCLVVMV